MTREEIREEVLNHGFSSSNYAASVNRWTDECIAEIYRRSDLRVGRTYYEFDTVNGTIYYSLPSNFGHISGLVLFDDEEHGRGYNLDGIPAEEFDNYPHELGQPVTYTIDGETIGLHPTPDIVYTLSFVYYKTSVNLVDDSDEPDFSGNYHHLIIEYDLSKAFARSHDKEFAEFHRNEFEIGLARMISELQSDTYDPPEQIGDNNLLDVM